MATSDVVAKARFVSLDSAIREHASWGYVAELIYKFEVVQYLKGMGANELVVRMGSGPKYIAFPDWIDHRTESEALELAEDWLSRTLAIVGDKPDAILLLNRSGEEEEYSFTSSESGQGRGGYPILGETWLPEAPDSKYWFQPKGGVTVETSLSDLNMLIEEMDALLEGDYAPCAIWALYERSRVRDQLLGIYRELTLGGYREPEAFPRYEVEIEFEESERVTVFEFRRPPYRSPRFSDYWLDGIDKDLFAIDNLAKPTFTYEGLRTVGGLSQGEYSVLYSQYHRSLPCDKYFSIHEGAWRTGDTTEWGVSVIAP